VTEAEKLALVSGIALAANVTTATVLIPHRTGDAIARTIWLLTGNDALGRAAVVCAAGLVAWTASH
jgi:Co/Zn/Cd efflux system component